MFSRPEAGKQNSSVRGPGSWIGTEDGRLASAEMMLEGIIITRNAHAHHASRQMYTMYMYWKKQK